MVKILKKQKRIEKRGREKGKDLIFVKTSRLI